MSPASERRLLRLHNDIWVLIKFPLHGRWRAVSSLLSKSLSGEVYKRVQVGRLQHHTTTLWESAGRFGWKQRKMATTKPAAKPTVAHAGSDCLPVCTLEKAMKIIVDTYHHYAPREGKDDDLSFKDMTELLQCQAPTFLAACNRSRPEYLKKLFKEADVDENKKLTFEEFTKIAAKLADDAHRISHGEDRCGPDKD